MRKALVGIAAALMLTTLVIAIVPAFAQVPLSFRDTTQTYVLWVDSTTHQFWLFVNLVNGQTVVLCSGVGAIVVKRVLAIPYAKCTVSYYASYVGAYLSGGGPVVTGPIKLVLIVKPPTKPMTFTLWRYYLP
jgi:hypothetical protein